MPQGEGTRADFCGHHALEGRIQDHATRIQKTKSAGKEGATQRKNSGDLHRILFKYSATYQVVHVHKEAI